MNELNFEYLEYTNSLGTKLTIELAPTNIWLAGSEEARVSKIVFNPNMPTEEVFGMPKKDGVNGIVYSALPLSYQGQLIENFNIRFENGKAVEAHAEKGEELLNQMINMDEGAAYLGEVALVPYSSPISQSGILFYNTLFDENASCHLALGRAFYNNVKDYEKYSKEEMEKLVNNSMIHVDFMIGTKDLNIVGVRRNGEKVEVFKDGDWAI
jgi:aminopeptidase